MFGFFVLICGLNYPWMIENKVLHVHINFYSIKQLSTCLVYNKREPKHLLTMWILIICICAERERRDFYIVVFQKVLWLKTWLVKLIKHQIEKFFHFTLKKKEVYIVESRIFIIFQCLRTRLLSDQQRQHFFINSNSSSC